MTVSRSSSVHSAANFIAPEHSARSVEDETSPPSDLSIVAKVDVKTIYPRDNCRFKLGLDDGIRDKKTNENGGENFFAKVPTELVIQIMQKSRRSASNLS